MLEKLVKGRFRRGGDPSQTDTAVADLLVADAPAAAENSAGSRSATSTRNRQLTSLVVLVSGIGLVLYPVIATVINNEAHQRIVHDTLKKAQDLDPKILQEQIAKAEAYNSSFSQGPVLDPFLQKVVPDSPEYHEYIKLLDFSGSMGSIHIPKIGVELPIYHGTDDATLGKGVGHLFGSSLPVGGESTKAVLTAHSGLGNATMFDELPNLKPGDEVFLQIAGKTLKYSVIGSKVVLPDNTKDLQIEYGKDLIVLITCTPYSVNTHRLLVTAERVPYNPEIDKSALDSQPSPWRLWMWASVVIVLSAAGIQVFIIWRRRKRSAADTENQPSDTLDAAVASTIQKAVLGSTGYLPKRIDGNEETQDSTFNVSESEAGYLGNFEAESDSSSSPPRGGEIEDTK